MKLKIILSLIFGSESRIIKYLSLIKHCYLKSKLILPFVKSNRYKFISKIFKSHNYILFQPNIDFEKKYFKNKYKFNYEDWFSENINSWKKYLVLQKKIKYLEIGTFEGRSAVFVGELKNVKEITCVDTFKGSDEHCNIDFNLVYQNCLYNLSKLKLPYKLIKDTSDNFFNINKQKFNVIYIDGSHFYEDVKKDFLNAINCLDDGGLLICDDFLWFDYKEIENNPLKAILDCYELYKNNLEILFIDYQIIFKKIIKEL